MTSFSGPREFIDDMMGLPEENWFKKLESSQDWPALVSNPVGDLAETERVFRQVWAHATEIVRSKPRSFFAEGFYEGEPASACAALRAIGAARLADMFEGPAPTESDFRMEDLAGMPSEQARQALHDAQQRDQSARQWRRDMIAAKDEVRDLLIRYLRARCIFPLEPVQPNTSERALMQQLLDERLASVRDLEARGLLPPNSSPTEKK